jgi:two-component system, chemotaxis family, protein-glutamate methylesterase/glutaminase
MAAEAATAIAIGGSAGALNDVMRITAMLPGDLPAAILLVLHFPSETLPQTLATATDLTVTAAVDDTVIRPGHIYVAPPDRHMIVVQGRLKLFRTARENLCRPAIDPTFRTAAGWFGPRLTAVLLSGMQSDGTYGLAKVRAEGGTTLAQEPGQAAFPDMPRHAIERGLIDQVLSVSGIGHRLAALAAAPAVSAPGKAPADPPAQPAAEGRLAPFSCPGCGGSLWEQQDLEVVRFRCHVGHAYAEDVLLEAQSNMVESALWAAVRALEEKALLSRRLAHRSRQRGAREAATGHEEDAADIDRQASVLYGLLTGGS